MYSESEDCPVVSPLLGNVCFVSSEYRFSFTLESFAKLYVESCGECLFNEKVQAVLVVIVEVCVKQKLNQVGFHSVRGKT